MELFASSLQHLTKNSLLLIISNVGTAFFSFGISLLIGRGLGETGLGRWTFLLAWISVLTMLCEFGLSGLLTRDMAQSPSSLNQLLITSLLIKIILILAFGGALWLMSPLLGMEAETSFGLRYAILIAALGISYASFTSAFRAQGWMTPILWINLIGLGVQFIGSWVLLRSERGVISLIQLSMWIDLLQVIAAISLWLRSIWKHGGAISPSLSSIIDMARKAIPFAISSAIGAFQLRSSSILLGYIHGAAAVGIFGAASRLSEAAKLIPNGIFDAAFPVLAAQKTKEASSIILYRNLNWIILLYTFTVTCILVVFSRTLLQWTYGRSFLSASSTLVWLGSALLLTLHNAVKELYLYATGDEKFATKLGGIGAVVQFFASLPLIFLYGAPGAAIGILSGELAIWIPLQLRIKKFFL